MASILLPAFTFSRSHTRSRMILSSRIPSSSPVSPPIGVYSDPRIVSRASLTSGWNPAIIRAETPKKQREPMVPPYNVLITGSTKGIGLALAKEFLKAGDKVVVCSRSAERVESTVKQLREEFGEQHVWGIMCDVRKGEDVKRLAAFARGKLNYIDLWINNAGSNIYKPLVESSDEDLMEVVTTNTVGLMICCREAINMMLNQPRGGHIFNTDGGGADGRATPRFAAYGATKRGVVHLTKSLQAELQMQDVKNVMVHNISPGMVTTDLLMSGATTKQAKFFINILGERPDVVAEYLVRSLRSFLSSQSMKPTYIRGLLLGPEGTDSSLKIEWFYNVETHLKCLRKSTDPFLDVIFAAKFFQGIFHKLPHWYCWGFRCCWSSIV